jgi:hypothetical protein
MPVTIDGFGNITTSSGFVRTTGRFYAPNSVVQRVYQQAQSGATHISTASTSESTLPLTATITPVLASSRIMVHFYSMMMYGAASGAWMRTALHRQIGTGSFDVIVGMSGTYPPGPYYGWGYWESSWQPNSCFYFDTPNTVSPLTYQIRYRLSTGSGTNYLVHQSGQYYGWVLTEIAQ